MTDRIRHITITLERDTRDDDVEPILAALRMVRGVAIVTPHVVTGDAYLARVSATADIRGKLHELIDQAIATAFDGKGKSK